MQISILGAGAIGLSVGAALLKNEVNFIGRQAIDDLYILQDGKEFIHSKINYNQNFENNDWLIICLKTYQYAAASEKIKSLIKPNTKIAIIQNGVEHMQRLNGIVENAKILPVMIDLPATRIAPNKVEWGGFAIISTPDNELSQEFCGLFANTYINAEVSDDFTTKLWRKLCINAPAGAVTCLTNRNMEVFHNKEIYEIAKGILTETILVGRAEGAKLGDEIIEEQMAHFLNSRPDATNSMLEDMRNGNQSEWPARNEIIVKMGKKHNIPTPVSDIIVPLLKAQNEIFEKKTAAN